jgi:hypothetical protein
VDNIIENEYDLNKVIGFYSDMRISRNDLERNNLENSKLIEHNKALLKENYSLEDQLNSNLRMLSAVNQLVDAQLRSEDILAIVDTVSGMSKVLGLTIEESIEKFTNDIKSAYTERTGYEFELEELERIQKTLQSKNVMLREQLEVHEEVLDEKKNIVESLSKIQTLGVSDNELIEWGRIIQELEYDLSIFREAIVTLGGLPEYVKKKTEHTFLLEVKEKELQKNVEALEERLEFVTSTLNNISDIVESNIGKISTTINDFENYFLSPETGFKARNVEMIDEMSQNLELLLSQTKTEWSNDVAQLNSNVEKIVEETSRILENAYKGGRIVGSFHSLEPIHKILREEDVPITEGTISVITMLTYIKLWLVKNYSDELASTFNSVILELTEGLGDIYKR